MIVPEWVVTPGLTPYADAVAEMEARAAAIRENGAPERIWLVEHPPIITAGTSAASADLLGTRLPIVPTGRGGRHTYHGPGQRVVYLMLDLDWRGRDLRRFVSGIEAWIAAALAVLGIEAGSDPAGTGVWSSGAKIAAIGVRVRRWVTFHGAAINVDPDLGAFDGFRPCGLDLPVTSLRALGSAANMNDLDRALLSTVHGFMAKLNDQPRKSETEVRGPRFIFA